MFKRIIAVVLSVALILTTPSVQAYTDTVRPASDNSEYSSIREEEYGLYDREVVEIEENTTVRTDSDYHDIINIADGKKLIFESGYITIDEGAVINGDIEIRGNASVNIYGTVNGCVTLDSDSAPEYHVNWEGALERQSNLLLGSNGVCDSIIVGCKEGFAWVGGSVGSLTVLKNAVCNMDVSGSAAVDIISYDGESPAWISGRIGELHASSGEIYLSLAKAAKVYVENTARFYIDHSCRVSELYVSGENTFVNNLGYIGSLACIGAPFNNNGEIGAAFVKDSPAFASYENSEHSYSSPYIIENLLSENSSIGLFRGENTSLSDGVKYGAVTFSGGNAAFSNTIIESVYAHGSIEGISLDNTLINSAFLDFDVMQDINGLNIAAPDRVFILNAEVSRKFFDNYYAFLTAIYGNKFKGADVQEVIDKFISVRDIENEAVSSPGTIALSQGDFVKVSVENGYVPCAVSVSSPDGKIKFLTMNGGSFTADTDGNYSLTVYGGYYGCKITTEKTQPLTTQINAYTGEYLWDENGPYISKNKVGISVFDISVFDVTDNREINNFNIDKNGLLTLTSEYSGHVIRLTAVHESVNWGNYWGYAPCEATFTAGSGQIEITALPYGEFSGYVNGSDNFSVYIYNSDGKYCGKASSQEGSFWSAERLPTDTYQLVIIDDPAGFYCFRRFSDFIRNGLVSGRHFIRLEFASTPGVHEDFYVGSLPKAPVTQSPYINYENTLFKSGAQSSVQGGMVEFTLNYAFKEGEEISDAYAEVSLPDGCEALGEIGAENGVLTLPLDLSESSVSFTVVSDMESDEVMLNASLSFNVGGSQEYAYIGASGYSVVNLSMYAPTATGKPTVTLSGFATPGQTVTIYDGDYAVTETVSGENGFWACESPLADAYGSYHDITAVLYDGTSKEMRSDTQTVYRSSIIPVVEEFKFSYYVHGHSASVTLSGDEWGKTQWSYDYWPGSIFTFEVKLTNSDNIEKMWISSNSDGRYYTLDGYYDQESGKWIATGQFCEDENYMPGGFAIGWQLKEDELTALINRAEELVNEWEELEQMEFPEISEEDFEGLDPYEKSEYDYSELVETADGVSGVVKVDVDGNGECVLDVPMSASRVAEDKTVEEYIAEGYTYNPENGALYKIIVNEATGEFAFNVIIAEEYVQSSSVPLGSLTENDIPKRSGNDDALREGCLSIYVSGITDIFEGPTGKILSKPGSQITQLLYCAYQIHKMYKELVYLTEELDTLRDDFNRRYNSLRNRSCYCYHSGYSCYCSYCASVTSEAMRDLDSAKATLDDLRSSIRLEFRTLIAVNSLSIVMSTVVGLLVGAAITAAIAGTAMSGGVLTPFVVGIASTLVMTAIDSLKNSLLDALYRKDTMENIKNNVLRYRELHRFAMQLLNELLAKRVYCDCDCTTTTTTETPEESSETSETSATSTSRSTSRTSVTYITSGSGNGGDGDGDGGGGQSGSDGSNPNMPAPRPDPSGYVFEAVESNRISGVTATVYYQANDRSEVKWNAESEGQVNPQLTDNEGKYGWMVPFGFWKVRITGEGYEAAESEWLQVPPPRVDVNLAVTSLAPANVKRVNICEDFAEIEFDKYMDISTMDGVISIDGKAYDLTPVNEEISGLGDGRSFATVFRAMLDTKAVNSQSYSIKVKSAKCYANISSEEYSGTVICAPIATALAASVPGEYLASGGETTISVVLEAAGGFENIAAPQVTFDNPKMAQVVSIGNVDASGKVDIVVKTAMAGMVNMNITVPGSAVSETIALPVAREQDSQLKKALSSASTAAKGAVSVILIIAVVLAAVLFICLAANITVSVLQAKAKRKKDSASESV